MNRQRQPLLAAGITLTVLLTALAVAGRASKIYWTGIDQPPHVIVMGTLVEVVPDVFAIPVRTDSTGVFSDTYSTGWVRIEKTLYGRENRKRLPVCWNSGYRRDPPPPPGSAWGSTASERHVEGERGIWVLWSAKDATDERAEYYSFQVHPPRSLERIRKEIEEYRHNGE